MTVGFELIPEDYEAFVKHHFLTKKEVAKTFRRVRFVSAPLCVVFGSLALYVGKGEIISVYVGLFTVVLGLYMFFSYKSRYIKLLEKRAELFTENTTNRYVMMFRQHTFSPEGINTCTEYTKENLLWNAVPYIHETPEYFFFYFSTETALILPKGVFAEGEEEQLREIFNEASLTVENFAQ